MKPKTEQTPCFVLGCEKSGLGVTRALGERGVPVVAVRYTPRDIAHVSRYVVASYEAPHPEKDERAFVDFLLHLASMWQGSVLMPCDDAMVIAASKHRDVLGEHFKVVAADWSVAEKFIDKKHTYALAEEHGVPCPRTRVASSFDEAIDFARSLEYPLLLKPCVGHRFSELFKKKMIVAHNEKEFAEGYRQAEAAGLEMMIQELIPGDDAQGANYNSFFLDGRALCEFTADKVRLSPTGTGFPRVVVSRNIPDIRDYGRRTLAALGYEGFSCVEFKKDNRNGVYKLMEVNGRQNLSSSLAVKCGINFPYITYRHALDGSVPNATDAFKEGVYWIDIQRDLMQSLLSFRQERFSLREYLRPYRNEHVYAVWSGRDTAPFFEFLRYAAVRGPAYALAKIRFQKKEYAHER